MRALAWSLILLVAPVAVTAEEAGSTRFAGDGVSECSRLKTALHRTAEGPGFKHIEDPGHELTDVQHYRLEFELRPDSRILSGSTTMTVESRIDGLSSFRFWLNSSMAISSVRVDGRVVDWQRLDATRVDVELDNAIDEAQTFELEVAYSGTPAPYWFFSENEDGPVISTLSQPWYASDWWATKEDNTDKATGELLVTVPAELTVVANGVLVDEDALSGGRRRYHWSTDYPTSPYLFAFAASRYNTLSETYVFDGGSMPVDFYLYPHRDNAGNREGWRLVLTMIEVFEQLYGPYPFRDEKYALYNFPFGGGMEHQTATGQGGNWAFSAPLTSHEVAHQWWGDMVTCASWNDIWLNEGFATYSTALWYEFENGSSDPQARRAYMESRRPQNLAGSIYVYDTSDPERIFSRDLTYSKAAWVVHMLRGVVGDEDFFETLAEYRKAHEYEAAETEDLRVVAEAVWGGDLEWFFHQWVYGGGAPAYAYGWQEHEIDGRRYLEVMIDQGQQEEVFRMPIDLRYDEGGQEQRHTVWNGARREHHLIPVAGPVDDVRLDPDEWILTRSKSTRSFVDGPPKIVRVDPPPGSVLRTGRPFRLDLTFHRPVVMDVSHAVLRRDDGVEFEVAIAEIADDMTFDFASVLPLPAGRYRLILKDTIVDAEDGLALDGELEATEGVLLPSGDGVAGGDAEIEYTVIGSQRARRAVRIPR
jgi:aminopeptidase N